MTVPREQQGVLKLVHPKGRVELHKSPITAAEVMRRNPRHCVTRPDVFKYPWIVVRPESVLEPGKVYFIVPNHTLRRLLETKKGLGQQQQHGNDDHRPKGGYEQPRLSAEEVDSIYDQFHDKRSDSSADELARFRHLVRKRSPHASSQHDNILKKPSPPNPKVKPMTKNPQETKKLNPSLVSDVTMVKEGGSVHETLTSEVSGEEGGLFRETVSRLEPVTSKTRKPSHLNLKVNPVTKNLKDTQKPNPHPVLDVVATKQDSSVHDTLIFEGSGEEGGLFRETTVSRLEPVTSKTRKPSPLNPKVNPVTKNLKDTHISPLDTQKPNPRPVFNVVAKKQDSSVHETHTFSSSKEARLEYLASRLQNHSAKAHLFNISTISPKTDPDCHVAELKSCLKKHKNNNEDHERRRGPRVRFQIPVEGSKGLRFRVFHFQRVDTP